MAIISGHLCSGQEPNEGSRRNDVFSSVQLSSSLTLSVEASVPSVKAPALPSHVSLSQEPESITSILIYADPPKLPVGVRFIKSAEMEINEAE